MQEDTLVLKRVLAMSFLYGFILFAGGIRALAVESGDRVARDLDTSTIAVSQYSKPQESEVPEPPSSIVDILSSNIQYSYFLRQLQRNGLIPFLNSLSNVTLLAPVNSAFAGSFGTKFDWDNNDLLRYVLDQVVVTENLGNDSVIYNTYYNRNKDHTSKGGSYPVLVSHVAESDEYIIDQEATIVEPDIYALHQGSYIQGIDKLLSLKPDFCQFLLASDIDTVNGHGIGFMKKLFAQLFEEESSISVSSSGKKKKKSKKQNPLPSSCAQFMNKTKTLFIPTDDYIYQHLTPLQVDYYTSLFSFQEEEVSGRIIDASPYDVTKQALSETKHDIVDLLENLMLADLVGGVNGTTSSNKDVKIHTSIGGRVDYHTSGRENCRKLRINKSVDSLRDSTNIVLSNGVIHLIGADTSSKGEKKKEDPDAFFQSSNLPVEMIPRKALYALHFSNVVEEYYFRRLDSILDGKSENQTIIVDGDDRDDIPDDDIAISSFSSKQQLQYQVLDGVIDHEEVSENEEYFLLDSKLCSKKRVGGCFKTKVTISEDKIITINDKAKVTQAYQVSNNTMIYLTDNENDAPGSLKHSLVEIISGNGGDRYWDHIDIDSKSCLEIFKELNGFNLFSLDENGKGYSIFLPCGRPQEYGVGHKMYSRGSAWETIGLTLTHLQRNREKYETLLKGFFVEGTIYSDFSGKGKYKNLNGDSLRINTLPQVETDHTEISVNDSTVFEIPLNSDILFNQGVVHITSEVMFPDNLLITMLDLIRATFEKSDKHNVLDLIENYPKLAKKLFGKNGSSSEFSLLAPAPDSLKTFNVSSSFEKLWDFLEFHLVPNSELEVLLACVNGLPDPTFDGNGTGSFSNIRTNLSDTTLNCKYNPEKGRTTLQLNNPQDVNSLAYSKNHEVHVLSHGCARGFGNNAGGNGCVFLIDKPLNLLWLEKPSGNFLHVSLGIVSVGIGIVVGLVIFGVVMLSVAMCINSNSQNKKQNPKLNGDFFSINTEPSFMSVRESSDDNSPIYDRGYETDDDMLRSEHENLLPAYESKRKRGGKKGRNDYLNNDGYGSTRDSSRSPNGTTHEGGTIGPLPISSKSITNALNRERNLPSVM
ncbi:hypothetical protein CLIB1423_36S00606 [[Candida] railenensis]|uniref:FAS1 domain-containing protein n=1 Tax=[Candida] railenensis TaxID=45579 RepID=A0A9P0QVP2_9ASCO|nr:hypothetical protein CLIB1423_36S00606 [[Candida] railenensis]